MFSGGFLNAVHCIGTEYAAKAAEKPRTGDGYAYFSVDITAERLYNKSGFEIKTKHKTKFIEKESKGGQNYEKLGFGRSCKHSVDKNN